MKKKLSCMACGLLIMKALGAASAQEQYMEACYNNRSGYGIPNEESNFITGQGGAPTYGEITYESLEKLFNRLDIKKNDIIYDMGSGVGKVITQAYLTTPAKKTVGVELSKTRINHARDVQKKLEEDGKVKKGRGGRRIEFLEEDISQTDLSDATIVYMCSTCFSPELMKKIAENAAKSKKPNLRIVTLKQLPENSGFELTDEMKLKMTWSDNVSVYIYEREKEKKPMQRKK